VRGQFFYPGRLEYLANELLAIYERKKESPVEPLIEADMVAESVGLDVLYEEIPEEPGRTILAEIRPKARLIVVNERRLQFIEQFPGYLNTTVAHELAHWWLHVDHAALDHVALPNFIHSSAPTRPEDGRDKRDEHNADELMSYLLMPKTLLLPRVARVDLQSWRGLYQLRDDFGVTISAMKVRLEKLGLTYVDDDGRFHKSRQEAGGQTSLF
jgi:Zn-dependent peptidase ImmA (M78 family)